MYAEVELALAEYELIYTGIVLGVLLLFVEFGFPAKFMVWMVLGGIRG